MFAQHMMRICFSGLMLVTTSSWVAAATLRVPQDHQTIQSAIDAAQGGDIVLVSAGVYKERLRLKEKITVKSAGGDAKGKLGLKRAEATILDGGGKQGNRPGIVMADGATLDGFTVTNVGVYDDVEWKKHHATHGAELMDAQGAVGTGADVPAIGVPGVNCTILNNIVHHNGHAGIAILGKKGKQVSPHVFRNIVYRNMGGGIGSANGSTAIIEENDCFQNLRAGIGSRNASPLIINNVCYENVRAGIGNREGAKPVLRGNKCYANRRAGIGVRMKGTAPIIEDNVCYENWMAGIGCRDGAMPIIRNNKCYKNKMAGIGCRDGASPVIEFNECFENEMAGIGSRLGATPVIRKNHCYKNLMAGIGAREKAQPIIQGNECHDNKMAGIGCQTEAAPIVHQNRCFKNQMAGIGSKLGAKSVIVENECFQNHMAGIGSREGAVPVIAHNKCYDNKMAGIGTRTGAHAVIAKNVSTKNHKAGIGVRDKATAILVGNQCIENKLVAVGVREGAAAVIIANKLQRTGGLPPIIAVREDSSVIVSNNQITGEGVAGVMVQGAAEIVGNQFNGQGPRKGGPPNFGVWVHGGSSVSVFDNRMDRWRHAVYASGAKKAFVAGNIASQFLGAGFVINKTATPPLIFGNLAISKNPKDKVLTTDEAKNEAASNKLIATAPAGSELEIIQRFPKLATDPRKKSSWQQWLPQGTRTVQDGPWKLVVTYGKTTKYQLYHVPTDPKEKTDLSSTLEHVTYRLRGVLERQQAEEFKKLMQKKSGK